MGGSSAFGVRLMCIASGFRYHFFCVSDAFFFRTVRHFPMFII
jgi:hypothetical protein